MKNSLTKSSIERYSRQIILKDIGPQGQKKIIDAKILIVGAGGLGCPIIDYLARAGVKNIGVVDHDKVNLSNLHRQNFYDLSDLGKLKVKAVKKKLKMIDKTINLKIYNNKINEKNIYKILNDFEFIFDGSDNFKTKFLLNKYCIQNKKVLIVGAISKFDGHVFTFDFKDKNTPCLKCFYQSNPSDEILNCEAEGILGPVAGIVGNIQANEGLKKILKIGKGLNKLILILNLLNLEFRKVSFSKKKKLYMCKKITFVLIFLNFFSFSFALENQKFLSLKNEKVNVRYGPGFDFPIKFIYVKKYLPVKIIDTKENFRRIIDHKKNSGWIHVTQLRKANSIIVLEDKIVFKKNSKFSEPIIKVKKGRMVLVEKCLESWCNVKTDKYNGWLENDNVWGFVK